MIASQPRKRGFKQATWDFMKQRQFFLRSPGFQQETKARTPSPTLGNPTFGCRPSEPICCSKSKTWQALIRLKPETMLPTAPPRKRGIQGNMMPVEATGYYQYCWILISVGPPLNKFGIQNSVEISYNFIYSDRCIYHHIQALVTNFFPGISRADFGLISVHFM